MASKNQKLELAKRLKLQLQNLLKVCPRQINRLIQNASIRYICSKEEALWVICHENRINLDKILNSDQLAKIRDIKNKNISEFNIPKRPILQKQTTIVVTKNNKKKIKIDNKIYTTLNKINEQLSKSYYQAKSDLVDVQRVSWAGTAHEIRETLKGLIDILAPDEEVLAENWYKKDPNCSTPTTQSQKIKYILIKSKTDSKITEVAKNIDLIDDKVANFGRSVYGRASDAAHRMKAKEEVENIMRYFEAFCHDLLKI